MLFQKNILYFEEVDSTNDYLKRHPRLWHDNFLTAYTRNQTAGRGSHDRIWHSQNGEDLACSILYIPTLPIKSIAPLTLMAGLAVYRALYPLLGKKLRLKWPNDIWIDNKKICGILCELLVAGSQTIVIIGIGINVNSCDFPPEIRGSSVSIKMCTGNDHDIHRLLHDVLNQVMEGFTNMVLPLPNEILAEWTGKSDSIGSRVSFIQNGSQHQGIITRIYNDGSLLITDMKTKEDIPYRGEIIYLNNL
jgi:BirA family biotin operon repressor/biotin-[acetyl-CoA-carboxylase] ligase